MPQMPTELLPESFSRLVEGLVADCERLAKQRENAILAENADLRRENSELRKCLEEAGLPPKVARASPPVPSKQAAPCPPTTDKSESQPPLSLAKQQVMKLDASAETNGATGEAKKVETNTLNDSPSKLKGEQSSFALIMDCFTNITLQSTNPDMPISGMRDLDCLETGGWREHDGGRGRAPTGCLLDPSSHTKLTWDVIGIPVLAWDLITIPMQVFDIGDTIVMIVMGWVTLIYWTIDMPVSFLTGFYDAEGNLVMDFRKICRGYLHGFFTLDLLIIAADWAGIAIEAVGSSAPPFLSNLGVLRALRISRFVRLMRLRKLKAKWQTVEDNIDSESILVSFSLLSKCFAILGLNHYIGCMFYLIGQSTDGLAGYDNWLHAHRYPQYGGTERIVDAPWGYQYLVALHWAITQFTPGSMHVQPQNIPERLFTIWCLIFGLVVFSAFIASVTQARMQLSKLMSKFERDLWLLRKYCRQNEVSRSLTQRMKRYVDLVLIPKFHKMQVKDIILLPQLSLDLREELQTELVSKKLRTHSFFCELEEQSKHVWNQVVMKRLCTSCTENCDLAKGDVIFSRGEVAINMLTVVSNFLLFVPFAKDDQVVQVETGAWTSEACLWTNWTHQGQLQVTQEAKAMLVNAAKVRQVIKQNGLVQNFAYRYAIDFLKGMNEQAARGEMPSDVQGNITDAIDVKQIAKQVYRA